MSHLKLIKLLKLLSKEEMFRLGKFLRSPFFNYTSSFIDFYDLLKKQYPDFEDRKWKPEKMWVKLFPNKPFHAQKFWRLCSDISLLVEKFLVQLELESTDKQSENLLIQAYSRRNAYPFFAKENQKRTSKLTALPYRDAEHYSEMAQLYFDRFFHVQTPKHTLDDGALANLMDHVDRGFVLSKMRLASEFKNRERILKRQYDLHFLDDILQKGDTGFMSDNPVFQLYRSLFNLYENPADENSFFDLKNLLTLEMLHLRRLDQSLLLTQLINYGVQKINIGQEAYYQECLDLYKLGLTHDLVLENGQINEAVYGNIALLGCRSKDFDWTSGFIDDYSQHLAKDIRADAKALAKSGWYFHQKQYEQAYDFLNGHSFAFIYQPKARLLLVKTIYELYLLDHSLFDFFNSQIDSFAAFLHRNKLFNESTKHIYLNYLKILKRLISGIAGNKKSAELKRVLIKKIAETQKMVGRKWLLDQVNKLK